MPLQEMGSARSFPVSFRPICLTDGGSTMPRLHWEEHRAKKPKLTKKGKVRQPPTASEWTGTDPESTMPLEKLFM